MLVRFRHLKEQGILNDRMALARAIETYNFPKPMALGSNSLAWDLAEVENWLKSRPRRSPKTGAKRGPKPLPAIVEDSIPQDMRGL